MALRVRLYLLFLPSIFPCPPKHVAGVVGHLTMFVPKQFPVVWEIEKAGLRCPATNEQG